MHTGFSKTFISTLPNNGITETLLGEARDSYKTCAVVSNAPSLRLRNFSSDIAAEIDEHDAVFRINRAPVKGYEQWVGSKETVRLINLHSGVSTSVGVRQNNQSPKHVTFIRDEQFERRRRLNVSRSYNIRRFSSMGALDEYMALRRNFSRANIFLNHPTFSELSLKFLLSKLMNGGDRRSLSTGAQAVFLAMLMCDKVTAYEIASADVASQKHRYYYDVTRRGAYDWWHPFKEESGLLQRLATSRRYNSSIYTYDMTQECARFDVAQAAN